MLTGGASPVSVFGIFLLHLWSNFWWFLTSGPLVIEPMLEYLFPTYEKWVSQFISRQQRWRIAYGLSVFGIIAASFFAFEDIYLKLQEKDKELTRIYRMFDVKGREEQTRQIERLETANAQLETALGDTRERLSNFEASLKPRSLTAEQRYELTNALASHDGRQFGRISVVASPSCQECQLYRDQIVKAIMSVPGWSASGNVELNIKPDLNGIIIGVKDPQMPPSQVSVIRDAFNAAKLPFMIGATPYLSPDKFVVIIGNKP